MRVMAIDYGDAHTGVAISDLTCQLAGYTAEWDINGEKTALGVEKV